MVASFQPDKRLLWHPRQENKFAVGGGSQISLYSWSPTSAEIRHVTSQQDLQFMKCFAWSPDAAYDDLIAVGLSTGRVDLMRLEASKASRNNILSSGAVVSLPVRNSRSCNSVAFCNADPNYLAVGLDKVRGDSSLVVWDVSTAKVTFGISSLAPANGSGNTVDVARPKPSIARMDAGSRTDARILQQHAPTEVVSSVTFLPQSTHSLLAGISHRWLRMFDLRSSVPSTTNVASKVHGIATDPFEPRRVASFGDGVVTIWDTRRLANPLLTFTEKDASADGGRPRQNSMFTTIEFSSTRRGTLAVLEKESTYVRFWDITSAQSRDPSPDGHTSRGSSHSSQVQRRSWTNLPWSAAPASVVHPSANDQSSQPKNLVLSDTRKTRSFKSPIASFGLVPSSSTHPLTSQVMIVNKEGDLELYAVHDTPKQASWSARGDLIVGAGLGCRVVPGIVDNTTPLEPWDVVPTSTTHSRRHSPDRSEHTREASIVRGRAQRTNEPAFGRGDDDGFPALSPGTAPRTPSNLAATRSSHPRTYSPATFRNYHFEHSAVVTDVPAAAEHGVDRLVNGKARRSRSRHGKSLSRMRDKSVSRGRKDPLKAVSSVVEEDISMRMRDRVIHGYGLGNARHNYEVTRDSEESSLAELWAWISHSRDIMIHPTPKLHGYDFSYQGVLGVWEGFQAVPVVNESAAPTPRNALLELPPAPGERRSRSGPRSRHRRQRSRSPADEIHGDFHAAITELSMRKGPSSWKPMVLTTKLAQRRLALQLCGWSLQEEDVDIAIARWEAEQKHSRAACWLVFTKQYTKAINLLMRSKDESHSMMSGTLTALVHGGSKNPDLREHCERLIVRLSDPYLRAMLIQLTSSDWSEVLEEESLPLRERLAIAIQFLEDKALSSYVRRVAHTCSSRGDIEGILVTGLTSHGMDLLQSYVDRTGDLQTAAILSCYISPIRFEDKRAGRWLDAYRDLLDGFKLFHHRVNFDVERGQLLRDAVRTGDMRPHEWAPAQILLRCNYCNKAIKSSADAIATAERPTVCPHCRRALPRCSICLMTLAIIQDDARDAELGHSQFKDTMDDAIVICQSCRHGGHASHILDWFFGPDGVPSRGECAVADCNCKCADEFL